MFDFICFVLGLSLMLNIVFIFLFVKLKNKYEIGEVVEDEEVYKDFKKEDNKNWNSFFNNNK